MILIYSKPFGFRYYMDDIGLVDRYHNDIDTNLADFNVIFMLLTLDIEIPFEY